LTSRPQPAAAPSLLYLGDSRGRFSFSQLAPTLCEPSLHCSFIGLCKLNRTASDHRFHFTSGSVSCSRSAGLSRFGYALHYGVAAEGPYHQPRNHYTATDAKLGSLRLMTRELASYRSLLPKQRPPLLVLFSSLLWDIARRLLLPPLSDARWAAAYEANLTAAVAQLQAALLPPRERLLLLADYGCEHAAERGGDENSFCRVHGDRAARDAAAAAARVGRALRVPVVDLDAAFRRGSLTSLLMWQQAGANKSSISYMHPAPAGSCVAYEAVRDAVRTGRLLPGGAALPASPLCESICRSNQFRAVCSSGSVDAGPRSAAG